MDPGPHHKVFLLQAELRGSRAVAMERVVARAPGVGTSLACVAPGARAVAVLGAAQRFKEGLGRLLKQAARLLYVSPALLILAPISRSVHPSAPAYLLAAFVIAVVIFFALFDLFLVAAMIAWARRNRGTHVSIKRPQLSDSAGTPTTVAPGMMHRLVRCVGRATLLSTGSGPILRAAAWSSGPPMELVECSTFAVVLDEGTPVVVQHLHTPEVIFPPDPAAAPEPSSLALAGRDDVPEASVVIREGDRVEVQGVVGAFLENTAHFDVDGVTSGVPRPGGDDDDPYRGGPGVPGLLLTDAVVIRKV